MKKHILLIIMISSLLAVPLQASERKSGWFIFTTSVRTIIGAYLVATGIKEFVDLGRPKTLKALAETVDGNVEVVDVQVLQGSVFWGTIRTSLGVAILYRTYLDLIDDEKSDKDQQAIPGL